MSNDTRKELIVSHSLSTTLIRQQAIAVSQVYFVDRVILSNGCTKLWATWRDRNATMAADVELRAIARQCDPLMQHIHGQAPIITEYDRPTRAAVKSAPNVCVYKS